MRSKHEKKNVWLDKAFYHSTHEYKQTHFRAWKKGKTWIYASAVVVLFAGNFANFANPTFLSAFGTITASAFTASTAVIGQAYTWATGATWTLSYYNGDTCASCDHAIYRCARNS